MHACKITQKGLRLNIVEKLRKRQLKIFKCLDRLASKNSTIWFRWKWQMRRAKRCAAWIEKVSMKHYMYIRIWYPFYLTRHALISRNGFDDYNSIPDVYKLHSCICINTLYD